MSQAWTNVKSSLYTQPRLPAAHQPITRVYGIALGVWVTFAGSRPVGTSWDVGV